MRINWLNTTPVSSLQLGKKIYKGVASSIRLYRDDAFRSPKGPVAFALKKRYQANTVWFIALLGAIGPGGQGTGGQKPAPVL